jgi:cation diffusion facilitator CzcD-associated flavoprotein CzcO
MYRFHPKVYWREGYPKRNEIVEQIQNLWHTYKLEERTKFGIEVAKVYKDEQGRWIINDPSHGRFDGIIAAVGTTGEPKIPNVPGQEKFKGEVVHSSQLDGKTAKGKKVLIIGGGASAVEALEFVATQEAKKSYVLARSEKWIIPRNPIIDALLSFNIFGEELWSSWIPENLLRIFFYRDLADIAPPKGSSKGLFTETPMVNDQVLNTVRLGKADWIRCDILGFEENGVWVKKRAQGVPKNGPGRKVFIEGDMVIAATGYTRPPLGFLPDQCFEENYEVSLPSSLVRFSRFEDVY